MPAEKSNTHYSPFTGNYYTISAMGGFQIEQHFGLIPLVGEMKVIDSDLTLALQLRVNVKTFNEKIGIIKDPSNNTILQTSFDVSSGTFPIQDISLNYQDILPDITVNNIIRVGGFSTMYRDFKRSIINYYEHADEVSLFDTSSTFILDEPDFNKEDFVDIFTTINQSGGYDICGNIFMYKLSTILQNLSTNDPFNNRSDKTYQDGFIAGDIVSLTTGISIRLDLLSRPKELVNDISYIPIDNIPPILLSKSYKVPLVLHLDNL